MNLANMSTLVIVCITVEALVEYLWTQLIVEHKLHWKQLITMILGIALALAANVDPYSAAGVTFAVPYLGNVLTGIVFSRGSNYFADFVSKLTTK